MGELEFIINGYEISVGYSSVEMKMWRHREPSQTLNSDIWLVLVKIQLKIESSRITSVL